MEMVDDLGRNKLLPVHLFRARECWVWFILKDS